jgi:hypothetical protein
MAKRENENSQLSKEEYEAQMAPGDSGEVGEGFARADAEQMSKRKIVRRSG